MRASVRSVTEGPWRKSVAMTLAEIRLFATNNEQGFYFRLIEQKCLIQGEEINPMLVDQFQYTTAATGDAGQRVFSQNHG